MSDNFLSTVAALRDLLNDRQRDADKLGILARSLRWHHAFDAADMDALLRLGELAQQKKGAGCWEVEQAVLEIMCEQASVEQTPFLSSVFYDNRKGKHSNDRRRLSLQALSVIAARTGHEVALRVLEEGLRHHKKDTRGWAIGFLLDSCVYLGRPLPQSVIDQLYFLVENDVSADVRVEAVMALASLNLVGDETVATVVVAASHNS